MPKSRPRSKLVQPRPVGSGSTRLGVHSVTSTHSLPMPSKKPTTQEDPTQQTMTEILGQLQNLTEKAHALQNQKPVVVEIPAGQDFRVSIIPKGEKPSINGEVQNPAKFTAESFSQILCQAANDLSPEDMKGAIELAMNRGFNIIRLSTACNGVLYHSLNAFRKLIAEKPRKPRKTKKP